ncbi:MAG: DNA repair protein RecN [Fluviicola sp.]|jgi:DNA repair protein RecN (Recombination protein N)
MLKHLTVRNFALIEAATLDFENGYTAITGETGSGKSILLGALNLILGERADYSVIRNQDEKTIVEGRFVVNESVKPWFEQEDIDWDSETYIRREITAQGKSRAFINDTPVQLSQMKELTEKLVYIHSQHETLELKSARFQFDLLDAFGDCLDLAEEVRSVFRTLSRLEQERDRIIQAQLDQAKELDYIRFQLDELDKLGLYQHRFSDLEKELQRMNQSDDLRASFQLIDEVIRGDEGATDRLNRIRTGIDRWKSTDASLSELAQRIQACLIELEDIAQEANNQLEVLEIDPERLSIITEQIDRYNHALRKHQVQTQEELVELENSFIEKLDRVANADEHLEKLENEIRALHLQYEDRAAALYNARLISSERIVPHLLHLLQELKLTESQVRFQIECSNTPDANGGMRIQLLFSANKGMELKPIEKSASGGELSRFMLAIQATLSAKKSLPTLILDEIDTGVSGEVALRIGSMLQRIGSNLQVIAITHLAQVAAKASHQLEVRKDHDSDQTKTSIVLLRPEERVDAIAKLLSGDTVTSVSRENAKSLMEL